MWLCLTPLVTVQVPELGIVRTPVIPEGVLWGQADGSFDDQNWMLVWLENPTTEQLYDLSVNGSYVSERILTAEEVQELRSKMHGATLSKAIKDFVGAYAPRAKEARDKWL